jgi:hypothetical protein
MGTILVLYKEQVVYSYLFLFYVYVGSYS